MAVGVKQTRPLKKTTKVILVGNVETVRQSRLLALTEKLKQRKCVYLKTSVLSFSISFCLFPGRFNSFLTHHKAHPDPPFHNIPGRWRSPKGKTLQCIVRNARYCLWLFHAAILSNQIKHNISAHHPLNFQYATFGQKCLCLHQYVFLIVSFCLFLLVLKISPKCDVSADTWFEFQSDDNIESDNKKRSEKKRARARVRKRITQQLLSEANSFFFLKLILTAMP